MVETEGQQFGCRSCAFALAQVAEAFVDRTVRQVAARECAISVHSGDVSPDW